MYQLGCILWLSLCLHAIYLERVSVELLTEREKDITVTDNEAKQLAEAILARKHSMDRQRGRSKVAMCTMFIPMAMSNVATCGSGVPSDLLSFRNFYLLEFPYAYIVTDSIITEISNKLYLIVKRRICWRKTIVSKGKENYVNKELQILKGKPIFCMICLKRCMLLLRVPCKIKILANLVCFRSIGKHPMLHNPSGKMITVNIQHISTHCQDNKVCHGLVPVCCLPFLPPLLS